MKRTAIITASMLLALSAGASLERSSPEGLRLLHTMQNGLGGAKRIDAVHDVDETIRTEASDASGAALGEVRKRTRWMRTTIFG